MTSIEKYLDEMKSIETDLLVYLEEGEDNTESNFQNLKDNFDKIKIREDQHTLMSFLHLLTKIADNHHRSPNFFGKIDRILQIFQSDIKKYYKNREIFNIFKSNKRILLFLIEQKIMIVDKYITKKIVTTKYYIDMKYPQYFKDHIMQFKDEKWFPKNEKNQDKPSLDSSTSKNDQTTSKTSLGSFSKVNQDKPSLDSSTSKNDQITSKTSFGSFSKVNQNQDKSKFNFNFSSKVNQDKPSLDSSTSKNDQTTSKTSLGSFSKVSKNQDKLKFNFNFSSKVNQDKPSLDSSTSKNDQTTSKTSLDSISKVNQDKTSLGFTHHKNQNKENWIDEIYKDDLPDNYHENRKIGENESYICKMIRDDNVIEFITYVNKNNISLISKIQTSIYETNSFFERSSLFGLKRNGVTLIEYAAFFGSIQIFQYLQMNGVELTQSLWDFVIHGQNPELIHRLEENHIEPKIRKNGSKEEVVSYIECYKESMKCHHNDITNYIQNNLLQNSEENDQDTLIQSLEHYNFIFLQKEKINKFSFIDFCHYGYYLIANNLLKNKDIDINEISNTSFNKILN